ncbi:MAG TPA: response regulator [Geobacteraceae bacterium]
MKTVLVIEDNRDNLRLITYVLRRSGYEVVSAETGEAGIELAEQTLPAFVIVDIHLPGMDGTEVVRRIRGSAICGAIPVVAITSHAMVGDREKAIASGCNGYFEKPINPLTIMERIHGAIGMSPP